MMTTEKPTSSLVVTAVRIENFKTIDEITLHLGRVNVLIGENGSGKTNILEAIGFGAAAAAEKLDREFLVSRGIRVTRPELMRSAFDKSSNKAPIQFQFAGGITDHFSATLLNENSPYARWTTLDERIRPILNTLGGLKASNADEPSGDQIFAQFSAEVAKRVLAGIALLTEHVKPDLLDTPETANEADQSQGSIAATQRIQESARRLQAVLDQERTRSVALANFLIFSPQVLTLRSLVVESQIEPLGIYGEGLFKLLKSLSESGRFDEVKKNLAMIEWFEDLELIAGAAPGHPSIQMQDQYMANEFPRLDEQSANDGFLFLLFYVCLFVSEYTPSFFAIDNIESALNPKLASRLMSTLTRLAKAHEKQVILTTHNPAILDGLDLTDDDQRLLVVSRNLEGRTRVRRIVPNDLPSVAKSTSLSEAFLRGYIGGLPTTF